MSGWGWTGINLAGSAASIVCFAGAAWLAYHDKDGWGWLIFAGILVHTVFVSRKRGDE